MKNDKRDAKILRDLEQGKTLRETANKYGISFQRINQIKLKKNGVCPSCLNPL